ncbi:hypothetical protein SBV1_1240036 [Verrucomicrobia bacterium]|nr:hypothetical protein SBV1_1240036 [Verrucomicrobiota bacterium]
MGTNKQKDDSGELPGRKPSEEAFAGMPKKITQLLAAESDRGVILILSAYLEELLGLVIRANCVSDPSADNLFDCRRPAGDFDSKIVLCSAFALISQDESRALNEMRKVRNRAAHFDRKGGRGFDVLFDSPQTAEQVVRLLGVLNLGLRSRDRAGIRDAFILSGRMIAIRLWIRLLESRRPMPVKTLKEQANIFRDQMKDTPVGRIIAEAERLARNGQPGKLFELFHLTSESLKAAVEKRKEAALR